MMLTLVLAILALFVLRALFVGGQPRRLRLLPVLFVVGCFGATQAAKLAMDRLAWVPRTNAAEVVKAAIVDLRSALADPAVRRVVILDGGSYPARGVDGRRLQEGLSLRMDEGVAVLQFTLPGANHYERAAMYAMFMDLLSVGEIEALAAKEVTILLEVAQVYDTRPLSQFEESRHSDRAYAYLSPALAIRGFQAWRRADPAPGWIESAKFAADLAAHSAVNAFGVGALGRHAPIREIGVREGYQPHEHPAESYVFPGLARVVERALDPQRPRFRAPPGFLEERDARVARTFAPLAPRYVRYALLSARPDALTYIQDACARETTVACIAPDDLALIRSLDDARYWRDGGHLVIAGARVYSDWLADRLAVELAAGGQEHQP